MSNSDRQTQMRAFRPDEHLMKLKGSDYLPAVWRVVWFREDHPEGTIDTEVVFWDHERAEIMVRAVVVAPKTGARATAHCVCSLAEFKNGYCEKAETQAVGRALALLGYGTAFAGQDLEEGDRPAEAPASVARNGSVAEGGRVAVLAQSTKRPPAPLSERAPVPSGEDGAQHSAADWTREQLRRAVEDLAGQPLPRGEQWQQLARDYGCGVPASTAEMTQPWLLCLYQAMQAQRVQGKIGEAHDFAALSTVMADAIGLRDRREISSEQYAALDEQAQARYARLAAPAGQEQANAQDARDQAQAEAEQDAVPPIGASRAKDLASQIRRAASEFEVGAALDSAGRAKDQGHITQDERVGLLRIAETRRAALSGPLTAQTV